jgi:hypothetical protein
VKLSALEREFLVALPVAILLAFSVNRIVKTRTRSSLFQLLGAGCLVLVVLTHLAEALRLFPSMGWGEPNSVGHYTDFTSAILGITLLLAAWVTP